MGKFKSPDTDSLVNSVFLCAYANEGNQADENGRPATNHILELSGTKSVTSERNEFMSFDKESLRMDFAEVPEPLPTGSALVFVPLSVVRPTKS